jgi:hypothetical protein
MKFKVATLCLGLTTAGFAMDEYMPIAPGATEVDVGYSNIMSRGAWTDEFVEATGSPMTHVIPLQVKYGISQGLDVELYLPYASQNDDAGGGSGARQPELGVKYAIPNSDFAGYLNLVLPFATGDFDVPGLSTGIAPGVVYAKTFGTYNLIAKASYQYNLEADDIKPLDVFNVYLKPGYTVSDKLGAYLGIDAKATINGDAFSGNLFTLMPGITYMQSPTVAYEVNIPVAVYGANNPAEWGIWASVYYTFLK